LKIEVSFLKEVAIVFPQNEGFLVVSGAGHVEVQGGHEAAFGVDGDATWRKPMGKSLGKMISTYRNCVFSWFFNIFF